MKNLSDYLCDEKPRVECKFDASVRLRSMTMSSWKRQPQCHLYSGCQHKIGNCCPNDNNTYDACCALAIPQGRARAKVKVAQCIPNAQVGFCMIRGCFSHGGNARCSGLHCYCNAGYCSDDNKACKEITSIAATTPGLLELPARQDGARGEGEHTRVEVNSSSDSERTTLRAASSAPQEEEEAEIEGTIPLPLVGFGIAWAIVFAISVVTQMLRRLRDGRVVQSSLQESLVQ